MANKREVESVFGKITLQEVEMPPCGKCKNKVCLKDKRKCDALVRFIKAIGGK